MVLSPRLQSEKIREGMGKLSLSQGGPGQGAGVEEGGADPLRTVDGGSCAHVHFITVQKSALWTWMT